ncbi:MAG: hypothetical protein J6B91_09830 [Prevotella sp.]|nr:hypothetical protein [Prevotella sp.]
MDEEKIYQNMPEHYLLCYNEECEQAANCLRRLAAKYGSPADAVLQVVNPRLNRGLTCKYRKPKKVVTMAYGMLHTYDKVLAKDIGSLRGAIKDYFGNGSYYLRRNGKRPVTPAEQQYISKIFRSHGYADGAVFDRYVDEVEW